MTEDATEAAAGGRIKAYFLSDLHLGAPYMLDSREREVRVVRFLDKIKHDATHIYLVGDVLDYWYEYRNVVPRGYVRFFGKLAELTDSGVKVTWLIGNHDIWIFDYIPSELGVRVVDGVLEEKLGGQRFLLSHGDGVGEVPRPFRYIRRMFRNRVCQWLFAGIHPRWTVPFAYAWSAHSRAHGRPPRDESEHPLTDKLTEYSLGLLDEGKHIDHFVYGHLHIVSRRRLNDSGATQWVLGDWLWNMSYAVFDGEEMQMYRYDDSEKSDQVIEMTDKET